MSACGDSVSCSPPFCCSKLSRMRKSACAHGMMNTLRRGDIEDVRTCSTLLTSLVAQEIAVPDSERERQSPNERLEGGACAIRCDEVSFRERRRSGKGRSQHLLLRRLLSMLVWMNLGQGSWHCARLDDSAAGKGIACARRTRREGLVEERARARERL